MKRIIYHSETVPGSHPSPQPAAPVVTEEDRVAREAACRSCSLFSTVHAQPKCYHPRCGCPADSMRVIPWRGMLRCPEGRWEK